MDIVALWVTIVATTVAFWRVTRQVRLVIRPLSTLGQFCHGAELHHLADELMTILVTDSNGLIGRCW